MNNALFQDETSVRFEPVEFSALESSLYVGLSGSRSTRVFMVGVADAFSIFSMCHFGIFAQNANCVFFPPNAQFPHFLFLTACNQVWTPTSRNGYWREVKTLKLRGYMGYQSSLGLSADAGPLQAEIAFPPYLRQSWHFAS